MTSWFNSWLRFWSLKMEFNGFPLQGALVWVPNIWIPSLASPLKTWVVEGAWHGENNISPHIFFSIFKRLRVHTVKHVFQKLICEFWSFWVKVIEPDQTVFHESSAGMSYFPSTSGSQCSWSRSCEHRCLKPPITLGPFCHPPYTLTFSGSSRIVLTGPSTVDPAGQPLKTTFVQMSERFETVFLRWEESPHLDFKLFLLSSESWEGNWMLGHPCYILQLLAGLPPALEKHQVHSMLGSVYFSFAKILLNWLWHLHNT